jgi:hypothetical protein
MGSTRVTYSSRPDATRQGEISTLSAVYKFVLERKKAIEASDGGKSCSGPAQTSNHHKGGPNLKSP